MTNPANFDDLYGAPKPNPPVRGQKPQGMFDDLYAPAPITPEEKSFADQLDALMSSPARPPIGPIPGPLWQPGTPEEAPPSVGPAEHQGFGWDMLGFGKELIRDPLGTLYNMVGRPIVHTLLDKQPTSAEEQTAMLATMFPASQLANPELQQLTARVRDNIESRRQTLGLIASAAAGGAAGEMSALANAGKLPAHLIGAGEFSTLAAGYDVEQAKKNLKLLMTVGGATAIVSSLAARMGISVPPPDAVSERAAAIKEARAADPIRVTAEPAVSGMKPMPVTEGRGFEVTGERATPPVPPETPTLAEMTGMTALQHEPASSIKVGPSEAEVLAMSPVEVSNAHAQQVAYERNAAVEVFGAENAVHYEELQRAANSTFDLVRANAASSEIQKMEDALTPTQQRRLFGIGETGLNAEDLLPARIMAGQLSDITSRTTSDLIESLARIVGGNRAADMGTKYGVHALFSELSARGVTREQAIESMLGYHVMINRLHPEDASAALSQRLSSLSPELSHPTVSEITPEKQLTQPDTYTRFSDFSRSIDEQPELHDASVPNVSDIKDKYPGAYYRAMEYDDPQEAMYQFADQLSEQVMNREINPDIAESVGGRFQEYLKARQAVLLKNSFSARVQAFARTNGIPDAEYDALYKSLADRTGEELRMRHLEPDEYSAYHEIAARVRQERAPRPSVVEFDEEGLGEQLASSNAMIVEPAATGEVVRDAESGELLARTSGPEETRQFITESGQAAGVSLDGGDNNRVPPAAIGGEAMPPQTPPPSPVNRVDDELNWHPPGSNWMEKFINFYIGVAHRLNIKVGFYNAIDGVHGTKLAARFFYPIADALSEMQAHASPWRESVHDIWKMSKGLSRDQLDKVVTWQESISADEIINGSEGFGRPANEREINAANLIVHSDVADVPKLLKFARLSAEIRANFRPELVENELNRLRAEYDLTPAEENVASLFEAIRGFSPDQISLGRIVRLADSIKYDTPSRGEYMAKNQFTPQMIKVAHAWDDFYKEISDLTGIDAKKLLQSYFPHYKANPDAPSLAQAYLFQHGAIPDRTFEFANEMIRTGEIDAYERDPSVAGFRYVNAFFKDKFLNPVIKQAIAAGNEELKVLSAESPKSVDKLKLLMQAHLRNVTGRVDMMSAATQDAFAHTLDALNVKSTPDFRRGVVNTLSTLIYGEGVSFRAQLVLRHINQLWTLGFAEYGLGSTMDAFGHLSSLATDAGRARFTELRAQGKVPGLGITPFTSQAEETGFLGSALGAADDATRNFAKLGMVGVRGVYDVSHFMWFEEGRARALRELNAWKSGAKTFQEALDDAQLGKYKLGVQQRFVESARNGKISEAADILGRATGDKVSFHYGNANSPHGWETNAGRLIGTYGVWPAWMQDYTFDMVSRGSLAQRVGKVSRFAMAQGAVFLTGKTFGLDMTPFYMGPGFFFDGDPVRGAAEAASPLAMWAGGPFLGLANAAISSVKEPNHSLREYARSRLMRLITTGFIPGRGAAQDVIEALKNQQDERYDDLVHFFARVAGVKPSDLQGWLFSQ